MLFVTIEIPDICAAFVLVLVDAVLIYLNKKISSGL